MRDRGIFITGYMECRTRGISLENPIMWLSRCSVTEVCHGALLRTSVTELPYLLHVRHGVYKAGTGTAELFASYPKAAMACHTRC